MESDSTSPESSSFFSNEYSYDQFSNNSNRKRISRRRQLESLTSINKPIEEYQYTEVFPGLNINAPIKINRINTLKNNIPPIILNENKNNSLNNNILKITNSLNVNGMNVKNELNNKNLGINLKSLLYNNIYKYVFFFKVFFFKKKKKKKDKRNKK